MTTHHREQPQLDQQDGIIVAGINAGIIAAGMVQRAGIIESTTKCGRMPCNSNEQEHDREEDRHLVLDSHGSPKPLRPCMPVFDETECNFQLR